MFQRTQEIIRAHVLSGRVLDIGGGAGIHARALMDAGYDVEMIDPVGEADIDGDVRTAALMLARAASDVPGIRDESAHLIAVGIVSD